MPDDADRGSEIRRDGRDERIEETGRLDRTVDARAPDPPQPDRRRAGLLLDLVLGRELGIATLVAVEGRRWAIEDAFETAKTELGLAHNETRSWHGWHRHVSLVMLAFAMMAAVRHRANNLPPPKRTRRARQATA